MLLILHSAPNADAVTFLVAVGDTLLLTPISKLFMHVWYPTPMITMCANQA